MKLESQHCIVHFGEELTVPLWLLNVASNLPEFHVSDRRRVVRIVQADTLEAIGLGHVTSKLWVFRVLPGCLAREGRDKRATQIL
jgi:hypothetical protein